MRSTRWTRFCGAALALSLMAGTALAAPVTGERLLAAKDEPQNWLTSAGDYAAHRYSGLDAIGKDNAGKLKLLFTVSLGPISAGTQFEQSRISAPLVDDGMLYTVDAFGTVYKIDVSSGVNGKILWTSPPVEAVMDPWLLGQWSVTLSGDAVVLAAGDGRLFWYDRETGAPLAHASVGDPASGYALAAPPLLVGDALLVAGAGGDRGARPEIAAVDATSGTPLWQTPLTDPGQAFVAGGSVLRTGSYDPETGLSLWATSGAIPAFDAQKRQGVDATNSVVAIEAKSGKIAWTQALLTGDEHGISDAATPMLLPDGGAVQVGDDGMVRRLQVASGAFDYQAPFVAERLSAETAMPPGCPNILAEEHMPASFSARTGLVYAAQNNGCRADLSAIGGFEGDPEGGAYAHMTNATGALSAIDPATGKVVAERQFDFPLQGGVLSLAGGLVLVETADGDLQLLDDKTLDTVWRQKISSFFASPPISYAVGGKQYLAFLVGGSPLYSEVYYRSRALFGVRHLTVLAVVGVEE